MAGYSGSSHSACNLSESGPSECGSTQSGPSESGPSESGPGPSESQSCQPSCFFQDCHAFSLIVVPCPAYFLSVLHFLAISKMVYLLNHCS